MAVPVILKTLEETALSTWFRESESVFAFYGILTVHVIALATIAGLNWLIDLRILGLARDIPLASLRKFFATIWVAFIFNIASGILLILGYPTKELTDPLFYVKMALIALGLYLMTKIKTNSFSEQVEGTSETTLESRSAMMARISLVVWLFVIVFGRLLAYTYTYLLYGVAPQH